MCSFDLLSIPTSSRTEVDQIFEHFTNEFFEIGNLHAADVPPIAPHIYQRAEKIRCHALACIIDRADFTQYALDVGAFCALVSLLQGILKG